MDHFLCGLDSTQNAWYNSRPMPTSHEFAIGNSSFQLIPIGNSNMGPGIPPNTGDGPEYCINNPSDNTQANSNSAFKPIHEVKIKSEGEGATEEERQRSGTPPPSIALTPLSANRTNSHKSKSGERWDTKKICNICGKTLSRGDKLKNHIRTHTNSFPYHCDACGQGFLRSEGLRVHTRIHTGERPYVCILCGKSYTRKDKLTRHAIIHTGERPFVCQHCGKSFTRKDKMQRHELIHRVDKPFTCSPCNLEFVRQETLNTHIEKKHPERLPYTLVQPTAVYHQNLSNMTDSKNGIIKESQPTSKDSSGNPTPAHSSASSSPSNTQATSTVGTETAPVVTPSGPLLTGNPLYGGIALPSSSAALGAPLLSGPAFLTSSTVLNGGLAFTNAPSIPGGSISHAHATTQS